MSANVEEHAVAYRFALDSVHRNTKINEAQAFVVYPSGMELFSKNGSSSSARGLGRRFFTMDKPKKPPTHFARVCLTCAVTMPSLDGIQCIKNTTSGD